MEFRLGNQQRHSITAVLLSAVVVVFGLVIADAVSDSEPDPLGTSTEAVVSTTVSSATEADADEDPTAGVARSNARFTLAPDLTVDGGRESTTSEPPPTTAARRATTTASTATPTTSTSSTSSTDSPSTDTTATTSSSTTESTVVEPPKRTTSTTVVGDETTTTRKCRGNRPGCREP